MVTIGRRLFSVRVAAGTTPLKFGPVGHAAASVWRVRNKYTIQAKEIELVENVVFAHKVKITL